MNALLNSPRGGWWLSAIALSGIGVFAFAIGALMLPHSELLGDRRSELVCLQMAFTSVRATALLMTFSPEQQVAIANLLVPGDMVFAWFYGLLLAGLVGLLVRRLDGAWRRVGAVMIWMPLAASLFDVVEDAFLYSIVAQLVENPSMIVMSELPLFAGIAATLKYLLLAVVVPLFSVAGVAQGLRTDRSMGALVVYALLLVVCASMVMPPLQQIPVCF
jgi:hypothetical protein